IRSGDAGPFDLLRDRHADAARNLAGHITPEAATADKAVDQAFAQVLDAIRRGGGPTDAFRPYLLTAVRRAAGDGGPVPVPTDEQQIPDPGQLLAGPVSAGPEAGPAIEAFLSLPERWRAALWHLGIEGAAPAEAARLLGVTPADATELADQARNGFARAYLALRQTAEGGHAGGAGGAAMPAASGPAGRADTDAVLRGAVAPVVLGGAAAAYLATDATGAAKATRSAAPATGKARSARTRPAKASRRAKPERSAGVAGAPGTAAAGAAAAGAAAAGAAAAEAVPAGVTPPASVTSSLAGGTGAAAGTASPAGAGVPAGAGPPAGAGAPGHAGPAGPADTAVLDSAATDGAVADSAVAGTVFGWRSGRPRHYSHRQRAVAAGACAALVALAITGYLLAVGPGGGSKTVASSHQPGVSQAGTPATPPAAPAAAPATKAPKHPARHRHGGSHHHHPRHVPAPPPARHHPAPRRHPTPHPPATGRVAAQISVTGPVGYSHVATMTFGMEDTGNTQTRQLIARFDLPTGAAVAQGMGVPGGVGWSCSAAGSHARCVHRALGAEDRAGGSLVVIINAQSACGHTVGMTVTGGRFASSARSAGILHCGRYRIPR
ncbi:MAG: hypothetical protein ABJB47_03715, partial [Actinomycetota bacterium]